MKVILLTTGLRTGGAERVVVDIADELFSRGFQVSIISLISDIQVRPKNCNLLVLSFNFNKNIFNFITKLIKLLYYIRKQRPDVIHSHMFHANIIAALIGFFIRNIKIICTSHSSNEGGKFKMFLYRILLRKPGMLTTVSKDAAQQIQKLTNINNIPVIENGIDVDKFYFNNTKRVEVRKKLSISDDKIVIMGVGRLVEAKGFSNLIEAFYSLCQVFDNICLIIVGDGEEKNKLLKKIDVYNLHNQVKLIGSSNEVHNLLPACDLFVSSSIWEGFSLVVAEAMSCQRVVVATDCGAVANMIIDSRFLLEINDIDALFLKLKSALLLNANESDRIGLLSREKIISNYNKQMMVDKWICYYENSVIEE